MPSDPLAMQSKAPFEDPYVDYLLREEANIKEASKVSTEHQPRHVLTFSGRDQVIITTPLDEDGHVNLHVTDRLTGKTMERRRLEGITKNRLEHRAVDPPENPWFDLGIHATDFAKVLMATTLPLDVQTTLAHGARGFCVGPRVIQPTKDRMYGGSNGPANLNTWTLLAYQFLAGAGLRLPGSAFRSGIRWDEPYRSGTNTTWIPARNGTFELLCGDVGRDSRYGRDFLQESYEDPALRKCIERFLHLSTQESPSNWEQLAEIDFWNDPPGRVTLLHNESVDLVTRERHGRRELHLRHLTDGRKEVRILPPMQKGTSDVVVEGMPLSSARLHAQAPTSADIVGDGLEIGAFGHLRDTNVRGIGLHLTLRSKDLDCHLRIQGVHDTLDVDGYGIGSRETINRALIPPLVSRVEVHSSNRGGILRDPENRVAMAREDLIPERPSTVQRMLARPLFGIDTAVPSRRAFFHQGKRPRTPPAIDIRDLAHDIDRFPPNSLAGGRNFHVLDKRYGELIVRRSRHGGSKKDDGLDYAPLADFEYEVQKTLFAGLPIGGAFCVPEPVADLHNSAGPRGSTRVLESRFFPGVAFSQISPYGTRVDRRVITWIADSIGTMAAFDTQKFAGLHKLATRLGTDHLPRPAATNYTIGPAWAAHGELVIHFFRSIGLTIIRDQLGSGFPLFPSQGERPSTLNHGDRNRDNVLIHPDEGVAMIDWELAFLGDVALEIALTKRRFQLTPEDMELLFADIEERQPHVLGVGHERPWVRQKLMKHLRRSVTRYEEVDLAKSITVDLIRFPKRIAKLRMGPEPKGRQLLAQLSPSTTSDIKAILNLLDTEAPSDLEHRVQAHLWRQSTFVLRNMKDSYTMRATPEMALAS